MAQPANVAYGVEETPPHAVTIFSGLQHVGLMAINLVYPVLIAQAAGASAETAATMVSLTLVALAVGTLLQVIPLGPLGSGYLCQPVPSVVYLVPSLLAAKHGGLALVFGMTIVAGLVQIGISRVLRHMRPLLPPEITGLVVLLIGIATGVVGLRNILAGPGAAGVAAPVDLALAAITLATMVVLNVWGRGPTRLFCVLIGMCVGYAIAIASGRVESGMFAASGLVAMPDLGHIDWAFDSTLLLPFVVAAVAATLKVTGNVTTSQKAADQNWKRPDMRSIGRGVLADGVGSIVAGALGTQGVNSSTSAVGLANATGVLSRRIAYPVVAILLLMAFVPKLGLIFYLMPRAVAGAALVFSSTFIVVNGLEMITSRLLDARKTLVIGLALVCGLAIDLYPAFFQSLPLTVQTVLGTSMVLGTMTALVLNALFRIGVKRTQVLTVEPGAFDRDAVEAFIEMNGARWGARRDVVERARFSLTQSIEVVADSCQPQGPLEIAASFDEFNLDIRVSYAGEALELPNTRPSNQEIIASEAGQRRLAGYMLRRYADRVTATHKGGRATVLFHFDH